MTEYEWAKWTWEFEMGISDERDLEWLMTPDEDEKYELQDDAGL